MYCLAIHCSIVAIMNKSQQDGLVGPPAERSTEGKEKKTKRRSRRYEVGLDQIAKIRQKLIKNSWNWLINQWSYYVLKQFEYEVHTMTGNGSYDYLLKLAWKNLWNHIKWTYFWLVLDICKQSVCDTITAMFFSGLDSLTYVTTMAGISNFV